MFASTSSRVNHTGDLRKKRTVDRSTRQQTAKDQLRLHHQPTATAEVATPPPMALAALAVLLCVGSDAMGRTGELFTVQAETGKVTRLEPGGLAYLLPEGFRPRHHLPTRDRFMEAYRLNVRTGRGTGESPAVQLRPWGHTRSASYSAMLLYSSTGRTSRTRRFPGTAATPGRCRKATRELSIDGPERTATMPRGIVRRPSAPDAPSATAGAPGRDYSSLLWTVAAHWHNPMAPVTR